MRRIVVGITSLEQHIEAISASRDEALASARRTSTAVLPALRPQDPPAARVLLPEVRPATGARLAQSRADLPLPLQRMPPHVFATAGVHRSTALV